MHRVYALIYNSASSTVVTTPRKRRNLLIRDKTTRAYGFIVIILFQFPFCTVTGYTSTVRRTSLLHYRYQLPPTRRRPKLTLQNRDLRFMTIFFSLYFFSYPPPTQNNPRHRCRRRVLRSRRVAVHRLYSGLPISLVIFFFFSIDFFFFLLVRRIPCIVHSNHFYFVSCAKNICCRSRRRPGLIVSMRPFQRSVIVARLVSNGRPSHGGGSGPDGMVETVRGFFFLFGRYRGTPVV